MDYITSRIRAAGIIESVAGGNTGLMMTDRYCQAVGCLDAVEAHKWYRPMNRLL